MSNEINSYYLENDLIISVKGNDKSLKSIKTDITAKELKKVIKSRTKELKEHFSDLEQGWDLNASFIIDEILYDVLGFHLSELVYGHLNQELGTITEYNKRGSFIVKPRTFVYYNTKSDKINTSKKYNSKKVLLGVL